MILESRTPCPVAGCDSIATTQFSEEVAKLPRNEKRAIVKDSKRNIEAQMRKQHHEGKHEPIKSEESK